MKNEYDLMDEKINNFWHQTFKTAMEEKILLRDLNLPLARIKRLMKVEEGVRMVASEVPVLFSMITEKFIEELTLRAWMNTEENKRRILQKSDLAAAVKTSEMYDFLIYIVPRNDLSRPFSQLMPNKIHPNNSFIGGTYMNQVAQDEREMIINERMLDARDTHLPQEFYMQHDHQSQSEMHSNAHMSRNLMGIKYGRKFDMTFNRDMNLDLPADITPGSFD